MLSLELLTQITNEIMEVIFSEKYVDKIDCPARIGLDMDELKKLRIRFLNLKNLDEINKAFSKELFAISNCYGECLGLIGYQELFAKNFIHFSEEQVNAAWEYIKNNGN